MFEIITCDNGQQVCEISFAGKRYGITYIPHAPCTDFDGKIGVFSSSTRRIKYMPLKWDYKNQIPIFRKSYIRTANSPEELFQHLITCAKLQTYIPECIALCEHVLANGHTPR